jgi:hypothetical protein
MKGRGWYDFAMSRSLSWVLVPAPVRVVLSANSNTVRSQRRAIKIGTHALSWARRYRA